MSFADNLKTWYRWGFWFDTPQGICVLLSLPVCWIAALMAFLWPIETRPIYLVAGPVLFILMPFLVFLSFMSLGQSQAKPYSSSWTSALLLLVAIAMPFCYPYFRTVGL